MHNVTEGKAVETIVMSSGSGPDIRMVDLRDAARWEYFRVVYQHYGKATGTSKGWRLDKFCLHTGYHRLCCIKFYFILDKLLFMCILDGARWKE